MTRNSSLRLIIATLTFSLSIAQADTKDDQQMREDYIRNGFAHSEENQLIIPEKNNPTAEDLKNWGVVASWNFSSGGDILKDEVQGLALESKVDQNLLEANPSVGPAHPQSCYYNSFKTTLEFQRGQYLELNARDSVQFNLQAGTSITVGGWIRARKDRMSGTGISGWLPFMSKMPANGVHSAGDWEFMSAGNLLYLAIHRNQGGFVQRDVYSTSLSSAWWADDPATCYTSGSHADCWHFISMSIDVSQKLPEGRTTVFRDFVRGQSGAPDYSRSSILPVGPSILPSLQDSQSKVRIGVNQLEYFQGQSGSLFFAKKALTPEQLKSIANQSRCQ